MIFEAISTATPNTIWSSAAIFMIGHNPFFMSDTSHLSRASISLPSAASVALNTVDAHNCFSCVSNILKSLPVAPVTERTIDICLSNVTPVYPATPATVIKGIAIEACEFLPKSFILPPVSAILLPIFPIVLFDDAVDLFIVLKAPDAVVLIVLNPLLAWSRTLATIGFDADALVAFAFPSTFVNAFDALSVALTDIGLDTAFLTVPAFAFTLSNVFPVLLIAVIGIFLLAFVLALEALATTALNVFGVLFLALTFIFLDADCRIFEAFFDTFANFFDAWSVARTGIALPACIALFFAFASTFRNILVARSNALTIIFTLASAIYILPPCRFICFCLTFCSSLYQYKRDMTCSSVMPHNSLGCTPISFIST